VIYALRAILLSVQGDRLVRANENFMAWLRGEKTMPFGPNGEHVPVRLIDFTDPAKNRLTVTNQWTYQTGTPRGRIRAARAEHSLACLTAHEPSSTVSLDEKGRLFFLYLASSMTKPRRCTDPV
jgi:type I restriction and modification enzyme subunit R-like protein